VAEFDRAAEDVGNIVSLEHVNVQVPDQQLATAFYVVGLGLTRDPYQVVGLVNMWINAGRCQFHLPTGKPQVVHGHTAVVMPGRAHLLERLDMARKWLEGTRFSFRESNEFIEATCPWGNRIRIYEPMNGNRPRFGRMLLGMPYVEIEVESGSAPGIARFYAEIFDAPGEVRDEPEGRAAHVRIGTDQRLVFRETPGPHPEFDGHHVAIYLANFSRPYRRLLERGLISRETNAHEYRFIDITDLGTGRVLAKLEHEVRSMTHPSYARPLVNRNPDISGPSFSPGHEGMPWALPAQTRIQ
jgi:catechol 2,3-dioxygenase-like lactoylglutathione lyase family enzyme